MTGQIRESKVLFIFVVAGIFAAGVSTLIEVMRFRFNGLTELIIFPIGQTLFMSPSVFFTGLILAVSFLVIKRGRVPSGIQFSFIRVTLGALLAALSYPIGVFTMFVVASSLMEPGNSDSPVQPPVPPWRHLVSEEAPSVALLVGGVLVVFLMALAFCVASRKWPRNVARWTFAIALGVPSLTILVNYLLASMFWTIRIQEPAGPLDFLLVETPSVHFPMLLILGEVELATLIGHWFFEAAHEGASSQA